MGSAMMQLNHSIVQRRIAAAKKSRGATLIEVLVAILLVSFGLLAMTGMQLFAGAASKNAVNRGIAVGLVNEILDSMRANPAGASARNYEQATTFDRTVYTRTLADVANLCAYPACTAATLAARDLAFFQQRVRTVLPAGGFRLQMLGAAGTTAQQADVWIVWAEAASVGKTNTDGTNTNTEENMDDCPLDAAGTRVTGARCLRMRVNL
jgi:type IV pilus assembly protein PilV